MKRYFIEKLIEWSKKPTRKPLVLSGARQVGKTWILKEFAHQCFAKTAYVNFDRNEAMQNLFSGPFDFKRILTGLQIETGVDITPGDTLIILDEIQLCGAALTSLKYWQENYPEYHVACAGSLIGLALQEGTGYPVGKTNSLTLYPMSFGEFLEAVDEAKLADLVRHPDAMLLKTFSDKLKDLLRVYYFVGGMPAAIAAYCKTLSLAVAREVQEEILIEYARDFAKHAPKRDVPRIRAIWSSLPVQLAKEDKRFVASEVLNEKGGKSRSRDLKDPFEWLESAGLVYRVWNVSKPGVPLEGYKGSIFKLYGLDVGLLGAQSHLSPRAVIEGDRMFTEFKGALTEQYVQQELRTTNGWPAYFWTKDNSRAEVDFVVEMDECVIPVEVKAEGNLRAKSLKSYRDIFSPELAVRASMADMRFDEGLLNVPLYAIGWRWSRNNEMRGEYEQR